MNEEIKLLDHGYVKLIETWGSDQRIIEAARMSTQKGFQGWGDRGGIFVEVDHSGGLWWLGGDESVNDVDLVTTKVRSRARRFSTIERAERAAQIYENRYAHSIAKPLTKVVTEDPKNGDEKLLRYLYDNAHSTPFEFAGMVIEVKAPIMVFREWHRHRSQGYNEASARYEPLPDENYVPTLERCMLKSGHGTKQAAAHGNVILNETDALHWLSCLADVYEHCEKVYQHGLRIGIPKEIARLPVPVARYSKMRATTNLRMWLAFATLRSTAKGPAAQWEIRQYADVVCNLLDKHFPRTWEIFSRVAA